MPARSIRSGSLVGGRYEILDLLGEGGMATVFKARDRALDVSVALKILKASPSRDPELARRFRSEIKLAWRVRHRNVCGIHEYGEDGDVLYISMELVDGKDLRHLLRESGPLVWEQAYDVAIQIAEGLDAIHEAGVIHRDLKPANITLDARGLVRLMDFGIAKVWGEDSEGSATGTGRVVGSPLYMSPEQVRGGILDFRSDLYAMGLVVYELFTGRGPFRGDTPVEAMMARLEEEPDWGALATRQIPKAALPILRRVLAREPASRYAGCAEILTDLRRARAALPRQTTDPELDHAGERGTVTGPPLPPVAIFSREAQARLLLAPLVRATKHPQVDVRLGAVQSLGRVSGGGLLVAPASRVAAEALGAVHREDGDERVRAAAAHAIARLEQSRKPLPSPPIPPRPVPKLPVETPGSVSLPTPMPTPPARRARLATNVGWPSIAVVLVAAAAVFLYGWLRRPSSVTVLPSTAPTPVTATSVPVTTVPETLADTTPTTTAPPPPSTNPPPSSISPRVVVKHTLPTPPVATIPVPPSTQPSPVTDLTPSPPPTTEPAPTPEMTATPTLPPSAAPPTPEPIDRATCLSCPIPEAAVVLCARLELRCNVNLRVQLSETGEVLRVEYLAGPKPIRDTIIKAALRWRYRPAQRGEQPVASFVLVDLKL